VLGAMNRDGRTFRTYTHDDRAHADGALAYRLSKAESLIISQAEEFRHHSEYHAIRSAAENPIDF
jgi:hypothetical protein